MLLHYLRARPKDEPSSAEYRVEYRLACSGELLADNVVTFDWRKSDATRVLLRSPFALSVVSRPFHQYPQELCLRFDFSPVTNSPDDGFLDDEEVVEDLCALMTLALRRLISPVGKVRVSAASQGREGPFPVDPFFTEVPFGVLDLPQYARWHPRRASVVVHPSGVRMIDNSVRPLAVDDNVLGALLAKLADSPDGSSVMLAARQYSAALELIEERPAISYQLLISSVETVASIAMGVWQPDQQTQISAKRSVRKLALDMGLDDGQADQLALEATKGMGWLKSKFVKFIEDNLDGPAGTFWGEETLYPGALSQDILPQRGTLRKVLGTIYDARSKALHSGRPLPGSAGIGTDGRIPTRVVYDAMKAGASKPVFPPVTWFERAASFALRNYVHLSLDLPKPLATEKPPSL